MATPHAVKGETRPGHEPQGIMPVRRIPVGAPLRWCLPGILPQEEGLRLPPTFLFLGFHHHFPTTTIQRNIDDNTIRGHCDSSHFQDSKFLRHELSGFVFRPNCPQQPSLVSFSRPCCNSLHTHPSTSLLRIVTQRAVDFTVRLHQQIGG